MRALGPWLLRLVPVGLTFGLLAAGNAVNAYSASDSGMSLCRDEAQAASGSNTLAVQSYDFTRGWFSQSMTVSFVTGWIDPDAEVTVQVARPVFFLPWRLQSQQTRVQPDRSLSL